MSVKEEIPQELQEHPAYWKKKCPHCRGILLNHDDSLRMCPICLGGSGEVYFFSDESEVRAKCPRRVMMEAGGYDPGRRCPPGCIHCHGHSTVPSEDVDVWWVVLDGLGFEARPHRRLGKWEMGLYVGEIATYWGDGGVGETLLEALIETVKKVGRA